MAYSEIGQVTYLFSHHEFVKKLSSIPGHKLSSQLDNVPVQNGEVVHVCRLQQELSTYQYTVYGTKQGHPVEEHHNSVCV